MCLRTLNPEVKIAEDDMLVYKRLEIRHIPNTKRTIFQRIFRRNMWKKIPLSRHTGYQYELGVLNPKVKLIVQEGYNKGTYKVEEGYHSDDRLLPYGNNALFVIPKGTLYIEGWHNEETYRKNYVSETIIFKKFL